MPLVDYQIEDFCQKGLIEPFDPEMINPASVDVRIGYSAIVERIHPIARLIPLWLRNLLSDRFTWLKPYWKNVDLSLYSKNDPFYLQPHEFLLVGTLETFNIPSFLSGDFYLKSSRAREGFDQAKAVWLDPGWHGSKLTMEVVNNCRYHQLPVYPGQRIGQVVFEFCMKPKADYSKTGRYNMHKAVHASKG